jgi:hypothetical protein
MVLCLTRRSTFAALLCALVVGACATSGGPPGSGPTSGASQFSGNSGSAVSGVVSGSSSSGNSGTGALGGSNSGSTILGQQTSDATAEACQQFSLEFTPRIPLVYVLVDSSGSMFDKFADAGDDWTALGAATLNVMKNLDSQVDFGWADYGSNGTTTAYTTAGYNAAMCGILNNVPIAPNNYANIAGVYNPLLTANMQPYNKTNTPATLALGQAAGYLTQAASSLGDAGTTAGGEYILFVTDAQTDFCDDVEQICATDGVIYEIQTLFTQGIHTLVLGVPSSDSAGLQQSLQAFANAGAGVPVVAPPLNPNEPPASPTTIMQQCGGQGGWAAIRSTETNPSGAALADYADPDAAVVNAPLYAPTSADVATLSSAIANALQTVKSCSFDLQGQIMVDLTMAYLGTVSIDGVPLPYVASADGGGNGWTMSTPTELDLVGSACTTWQTTGMSIAGSFPCQVIHPVPPR